jgi:transposase
VLWPQSKKAAFPFLKLLASFRSARRSLKRCSNCIAQARPWPRVTVEAPLRYCKSKRRRCCGRKSVYTLMPRWQSYRRFSLTNARLRSVSPRSPAAYRFCTCPVKKSLIASERDEKARKKFRKLTSALDSGKYIFIDEMGSHLGFTRLYGRAEPGKRVLDQVPGDCGGNVSTIGAIGRDGIRTGLSVPGAIDGDTMLFFVEELLVPTLNRGDIVFMDNNPIHKLDDIEDAIEAVGAWVLFLPAYSPDLNPIENCWSKVKSLLRSRKPRTLPDLLDALVKAFSSITVHDIRGWFRHCGYRVALT